MFAAPEPDMGGFNRRQEQAEREENTGQKQQGAGHLSAFFVGQGPHVHRLLKLTPEICMSICNLGEIAAPPLNGPSKQLSCLL